MSAIVSNAIMRFASTLGCENLSLSGMVIELPTGAWRALVREVYGSRRVPGQAPAMRVVLATPNGDVTIRQATQPAAPTPTEPRER